MSNELMEYTSQSGDKIQLTPATVKQYLVSGDADNVSDQEIKMFLELCKYQKLNPFLKEVYLIKYGTSPATIVTGKEAFLKRATKNPVYRGHKTGISGDGQTAWAEVYKEAFEFPVRVEVDLEEYIGKKGNGEVNAQWKSKPKTMLKKVALVQALRESFPDALGGMYTEEEADSHVAAEPIDITPKETKTSTVKPAESKPAAASKPAATSSTAKVKPQEELETLLLYYCHGDEDAARELLKELSIFGEPGKENWIKELGGGTEKWAGKTLSKLKEKLKKEQGLPGDCKFNPEGCNNASMEDGLAYCGPKNCPFQPERKF